MVLGITLSNNLSCRSIFDANLLLYAKLSYTAFRLSEFSKRTFKARSVEVSPRGGKVDTDVIGLFTDESCRTKIQRVYHYPPFPGQERKREKRKKYVRKKSDCWCLIARA